MSYLNSKALALKPSETLAIKAQAAKLKAAGRSIIDLSAGEPDIDTPEHIKQGALEAMRQGHTKYTAVQGIAPLLQAIATKLTSENEIAVDASQVIVCNGGKQAISQFFEVVLEEGDEVLILAPYWVSYPAMVELAGAKPHILKTKAEHGYKVSPSELRAALTSKTKVIVINSPSNPTGAAYSRQELAELGKVIESSKALVLSDEVYEKLTFGHFQFCSFAQACPALINRCVTVNAFSKTFSMTGWRVGYAAGPKEIIEAMSRYQSQSTSNVCSIAQYAALAALQGSSEFLKDLKRNYQLRLDMSQDLLSSISGLGLPCAPLGAFYLFVRFEELKSKLTKRGINTSGALSAFLLEQSGVAVVPGEAFGDDNAFRISIACSEQNLREGLSRLSQVFAALE